MKYEVKYSGKRKKPSRAKNKVVFLALGAIFLAGVGPLIADQIQNTDQQNSVTETATVESSISPTPLPDESASPSISPSPEEKTVIEPSSNSQPDSITAKATPSPTKIPPFAVKNQDMAITIPRVQRVDPRATRLNLPQVNFYAKGSPYLMLCMNSSRANIDVEAKGIDDSLQGKGVFINGDLSSAVQISGTSGQVLNIFNSFGGLRLIGPGGKGVSGTNVLFRFVAISEPTNNFALCGESAGSSQWLLEVQPLELQVDTKKNPVKLGDKGK